MMDKEINHKEWDIIKNNLFCPHTNQSDPEFFTYAEKGDFNTNDQHEDNWFLRK